MCEDNNLYCLRPVVYYKTDILRYSTNCLAKKVYDYHIHYRRALVGPDKSEPLCAYASLRLAVCARRCVQSLQHIANSFIVIHVLVRINCDVLYIRECV